MQTILKSFLLLLALATSSEAAAQQHQWQLTGGTPGEVQAVTAYNLYCTINQQCLFYEYRKKGINLGWKGVGEQPLNVIIVKEQFGNITNMERVAIFVVGGGYLKYQPRDNGVNLVFTDEPTYEWKISANNKAATPLRTDTPYSLYNMSANRCLVYSYRKGPVANLGLAEEE